MSLHFYDIPQRQIIKTGNISRAAIGLRVGRGLTENDKILLGGRNVP